MNMIPIPLWSPIVSLYSYAWKYVYSVFLSSFQPQPNVLKDTLEHASTYFPQVSDSKVFVSIAAGVTLETISTHVYPFIPHIYDNIVAIL